MKYILNFTIIIFVFTGCAQVEQEVVTSSTGGVETGYIQDTIEGATEEVIEVEDFGEIITKISETYTTNNDFKMCFKHNIDMCIQNVSMGEEVMNCDDFILETNKNSCIQSQMSMKAILEKDIGMCATLKTGKESCEYEVAVNLGIIDYNTEMCSNLSESYKISCNNRIVMSELEETKNIKVCDKLLGDDDKMLDYDKESCVEEVGYMILEDKILAEQERESMIIQEEENKRIEYEIQEQKSMDLE